jgi:solute carrier family 50 protein (sugar transporter)
VQSNLRRSLGYVQFRVLPSCGSQVNPDVFPLLFGNAIGWVIYSGCTHNVFIFAANFTNVLAGMFYILTGYMLTTSDDVRRRMEAVTLTMLGLWTSLGFAATQIPDEVMRNNMIGSTANVIVLLLFASPLSTVAKIVRIRSAASINKPFALVQVFNCLLWTLYGLVVADLYIWAPNALGLALGALQMALLLLYGSKPLAPTDESLEGALISEGSGYPP